jgi:hypothetical protein
MPHKKRPPASGIADGSTFFSNSTAEDSHLAHRLQHFSVARIARRFRLPIATAAMVAELAMIGGAA